MDFDVQFNDLSLWDVEPTEFAQSASVVDSEVLVYDL